MSRKRVSFPLGGGLNLIDPVDQIPAGMVRSCLNVECPVGNPRSSGYRRVKGHERYDGRPSPSQSYQVYICYAALSPNPVSIGSPIVAAGGLWSADVIGLGQVYSGDYGTADAYVSFYITNPTGPTPAFNTPLYQFGGTPVGNFQDYGLGGWTQPGFDAAYNYLSSLRRGLIQAVPGDGPVRGVFTYRGVVYAMRNGTDPALGLAGCNLYRATPSGWVFVPPSYITPFTNGLNMVEGEVITRGTNSGVIGRISVEAGDMSLGTAQGFIAFYGTGPSPAPFSPGAATTAGGGSCNTNISFRLPFIPRLGNKIDVREYNFNGAAGADAIYAAPGPDEAGLGQLPGFELRGDVASGNYTLVAVGPTIEGAWANHCAVFNGQLWFAFNKGSLQNSPVADPVAKWNVRFGAGEIGIGDEITDLVETRYDTLAVYGRNTVSVLYNTPELKRFTNTIGALPHTAVNVGSMAVATDYKGAYQLNASQAFGDFESAFISKNITPLMTGDARFALTIPSKGQYRLYLDGGFALTATFAGDQLVGWTQQQPFHSFVCGHTGESLDGQEIIVAGAENGYVYKLETGDLFDTAGIYWGVGLQKQGLGDKARTKRLHSMDVEYEETPSGPDYEAVGRLYMNLQTSAANNQNRESFDITQGGETGVAYADVSMVGTEFTFGIQGAPWVQTQTAPPATLTGVRFQYTPLGLRR